MEKGSNSCFPPIPVPPVFYLGDIGGLQLCAVKVALSKPGATEPNEELSCFIEAVNELCESITPGA